MALTPYYDSSSSSALFGPGTKRRSKPTGLLDAFGADQQSALQNTGLLTGDPNLPYTSPRFPVGGADPWDVAPAPERTPVLATDVADVLSRPSMPQVPDLLSILSRRQAMPNAPQLGQLPQRDRGQEARRTIQGAGLIGLLSLLTGNRDVAPGAIGGFVQNAGGAYDQRAQEDLQQYQTEQQRALQQNALARQQVGDYNDQIDAQQSAAVGQFNAGRQVYDAAMNRQDRRDAAKTNAEYRARVQQGAVTDDIGQTVAHLSILPPEGQQVYLRALDKSGALRRMGDPFARLPDGSFDVSGIKKTTTAQDPAAKARTDRLKAELSDVRSRLGKYQDDATYNQLAARYKELDTALGGPGSVPPRVAPLTPAQQAAQDRAAANAQRADERLGMQARRLDEYLKNGGKGGRSGGGSGKLPYGSATALEGSLRATENEVDQNLKEKQKLLKQSESWRQIIATGKRLDGQPLTNEDRDRLGAALRQNGQRITDLDGAIHYGRGRATVARQRIAETDAALEAQRRGQQGGSGGGGGGKPVGRGNGSGGANSAPDAQFRDSRNRPGGTGGKGQTRPAQVKLSDQDRRDLATLGKLAQQYGR